MGSDGVSEIGAVAGERAGRMVNGTSLALGSVAGLGAGGACRSVEEETGVQNELAEVGIFFK